MWDTTFDDAAAWHYGDLRATLQAAGTSVDPNDLLIAAHALSAGLPLVTNNVTEFERVPGLKVENWFSELTGTDAALCRGQNGFLLSWTRVFQGMQTANSSTKRSRVPSPKFLIAS